MAQQAIVVKSDVTGPVRKTATLLQHVRNVFTQVMSRVVAPRATAGKRRRAEAGADAEDAAERPGKRPRHAEADAASRSRSASSASALPLPLADAPPQAAPPPLADAPQAPPLADGPPGAPSMAEAPSATSPLRTEAPAAGAVSAPPPPPAADEPEPEVCLEDQASLQPAALEMAFDLAPPAPAALPSEAPLASGLGPFAPPQQAPAPAADGGAPAAAILLEPTERIGYGACGNGGAEDEFEAFVAGCGGASSSQEEQPPRLTGSMSDREALLHFRELLPGMLRRERLLNAAAKEAVRGRGTASPPSPAQSEEAMTMVEWLVQAHRLVCTRDESLYLAIRVVDRCCARQHRKVQRPLLLAGTALFIASKFDEEMYPTMQDLVKLGRSTFTFEDLTHEEPVLLHVLDYRLHDPLPLHFLPGYQKELLRSQRRHSPGEDVAECDCPACMIPALSAYICELGFVSQAGSRWRPSLLAAAAVVLAANLLDLPVQGRFAADISSRRAEIQTITCKLWTALMNMQSCRPTHYKHLMKAASPGVPLRGGFAFTVMDDITTTLVGIGRKVRLHVGFTGIVDRYLPDGSIVVMSAPGSGQDRYQVAQRDAEVMCRLVFGRLARVLEGLGIPLCELGRLD